MCIKTISLGLLLFALPAASAGQQDTQLAQRAQACARAATTLQSPDRSIEYWRAVEQLPVCGRDGGRLLARELGRSRTDADSVTLLRLYFQVARIEDANVLDSALALAADPHATPESRIIALKLLVSYVDPSLVSLPFSGFLPGHQPVLATQDHFGRLEATPLPPDWRRRAIALAERLENGAADGDTIRHAAHVALRYLKEPTH